MAVSLDTGPLPLHEDPALPAVLAVGARDPPLPPLRPAGQMLSRTRRAAGPVSVSEGSVVESIEEAWTGVLGGLLSRADILTCPQTGPYSLDRVI